MATLAPVDGRVRGQASGEGIHPWPKFTRDKPDRSVSRVWRRGFMAGGVWWGTESELGRRSLRRVCLQLVLITGLMWCSDLKHTLTLQSQVKAGYGF